MLEPLAPRHAAEIAEGAAFPAAVAAIRRKPVADRYRIGTNPIDTDSIALVVKKWVGQAGRDGATFAGHNLRRGAISSRVAQGVHITRLRPDHKQRNTTGVIHIRQRSCQ